MGGIAGTIKTQTGGDSYAYLLFVPKQGFLAFAHHGDYPLYSVNATIVDLDNLNMGVGITIPVGDMIKGHATCSLSLRA